MISSIVLGGIVCLYVIRHIEMEDIKFNIKRKLTVLKYKTIGILLWPIIFYMVVPHEEIETKKMLASFIWPFFIWAWDSYLLTYGLISESSSSNVASARLDPSTVSSMSFALFGLLGGSSNGKYSYIFLYAILMCIAFVFPNHNLASGSPEDILVESIQKTILTWAIGMLFIGVTLQHSVHQKKLLDDCAKIVDK